ncbi:hypothetical protein Z042_21300 [Chania multitudinisentens RB-25]|uniref:Polysaccharide chain length determinant N-terminal domain-containing protein n=1 Tax=Chania multitudinisentens RB-25 TaxID=1441930 RepID=W0LLP5_9GAMM|nr:Wzz/FepE/Etk N-terminal domain-containing protein [Chania multitudinisentens]AHG22955.1 hypothetical protein Z042_21300 [Chania multitudinisentens RB-25]
MPQRFSSSVLHNTDTQVDSFLLSTPLNSNHNEKDLFALLQVLWRKRWFIIAVIICFTLLAAIYAFTAKQKWTANAVLLPPRIAQLGDYLELRRNYGLVLQQSVEPEKLSKQLFSEFTAFSGMIDEKMSFLQQSDYYKKNVANLNNSEEKQAWLINAAEKKLNVKATDNVKGELGLTISMQADSATTAKQLLDNYIQVTNEKTFSVVNSEFLNSIQAWVNTLQKERQDIIFDVNAKRDAEIKALKSDLIIAQKSDLDNSPISGITYKNRNIESDTKYRFMLGEKILNAELQQLQQSEPSYPVRYYQIENELQQLAALKQKKANAQSYSYELTPLLPTQRDAPKRNVILVLGALLGLISGIGWVLLKHTVRLARETKPA